MSRDRTSDADIRRLLDTSASDEAVCDAYDRLLTSLNGPSAMVHRMTVAAFTLHRRPHLAEHFLWSPVCGYFEHDVTPERIVLHAASFGDSDWLSEMAGPDGVQWLREELPKLTGLLGRLLWEVAVFRRLDDLFTRPPPAEADWLTQEVANRLWCDLRQAGRVSSRKRALLAAEVCRAGVMLFRDEATLTEVIRRFEARAVPGFRTSEADWPDLDTAVAYGLNPTEAETRDLAPRVREILGNPLRPVTLDPSWRTETVVAIASLIEAERAFDRLPILADAVEEAGCDDGPLLDHCRGPGPHAPGCWALDAILGWE